jgi:DHA1 family chloramphenicol resistance protein-like MFS transporter
VPALTVPLVFLLGAFGFSTNPSLNTRVFTLANDAPTLAAATNFSAFNVGITAGPWLGGLAIGAGSGYPSVAWIGAALSTLALGTVALASALRSPRPGPVTVAGTGGGTQEPAACPVAERASCN